MLNPGDSVTNSSTSSETSDTTQVKTSTPVLKSTQDPGNSEHLDR